MYRKNSVIFVKVFGRAFLKLLLIYSFFAGQYHPMKAS